MEESELQRLPAEEAELLPHPQAAEAPAQGGMQADVQRRAAEGAVARDAAAASGELPPQAQENVARGVFGRGIPNL